MKYTRDDVIMWSDDEKLVINKEYFFSDSAEGIVKQANRNELTGRLIGVNGGDVDYPFIIEDSDGDRSSWHFLILKKEPEKMIVPFDFSLEEDRDAVKDKWLIHVDTGSETKILHFCKASNGYYTVEYIMNFQLNSITSSGLLEQFVFADGPNKGKPVGKEVEE